MLSTVEIKIGDTVTVNFYQSQHTLCKNAKVLSVPSQNGDSWIFQEDDKIHYVSEPCTISKFLVEQKELEIKIGDDVIIKLGTSIHYQHQHGQIYNYIDGMSGFITDIDYDTYYVNLPCGTYKLHKKWVRKV